MQLLKNPICKYICFGRRATIPCTGQRTFSQKKVDPVVMEEIYSYLDTLQTLDLSSKIDEMQGKVKRDIETTLQAIKTQISKIEKELELLNKIQQKRSRKYILSVRPLTTYVFLEAA